VPILVLGVDATLHGTAAAEAKSHRHADGLIRTPRAGQRVPARTTLIRVHTGDKRGFRAWLNGEEVHRHFSRPSRRGVRKLNASPSHGLHHGWNRLHVRVRGRGGRKRSTTTRFRVRGTRPLAAPGLERRHAVGARIYLAGRRSLLHPQARRSGRAARRFGYGGLRYRWRVVHAPRGSSLRRGGTRVARGGESGVSGSTTPTPSIEPDVPGTYTVRLDVTAADGQSGSSLMKARVDPSPVVPVDTMAFQGPSPNQEITQSGIKVGAGPCPGSAGCYPSDGLHHWAQLVALDRRTLQPVGGKQADLANKGYDCAVDHCPSSQQAQLLASDLARLGPDTLAIVANPQPDPSKGFNGGCIDDDAFVPVGLEQALTRIGVEPTGFDQGSPDLCSVGAISAIGVPGTKPGEGDWHSTISQPGGGRMQGYLVRSNEGNYTFEAYDRVDFDTQAEGTTESQNVIQVGGKTFTQGFAGGIRDGGGFQVVVLDARTLEGASHWFETDHSDKSALLGQLRAMRQTIHDANGADGLHRKLVFITSLGMPAIQYYSRSNITTPDDEINSALSQLVDEVEQLGGTRNGFYKMLDPALYGSNGYSYTLFSAGSSGPGRGEEELGTGISGTGAGPLNTAPLSGKLARTGPSYGFELEGSLRVGPEESGVDPSRATSELMHVAFQPPTEWPESGNDGRRNAIAWVGAHSPLKTDYPRGQYWTRPYLNTQFDYSGWSEISSKIQKLDYTQATEQEQQGFTAADLMWAKAELAQEIAWLQATHRYLDSLSTPFAQGQLESWAQLQQVAAEVNSKVQASSDAKARATVGALFNFFGNLAEEAPFVGKAVHVVNDVYDLVMEMTEINGEPADDDFASSVGKVGEDLAKRLVAAQGILTRQMPHIIAADYGKLKTVGACASQDQANCPFDVDDWQYTSDDQQNAARALLQGANVWAYSEVMPAKYTLYRLAPWWRDSVGGVREFKARGFPGDSWPFLGLPNSAQLAKPIYRNIPTYEHEFRNCNVSLADCRLVGETWQIFPLGFLKDGNGTLTNQWNMGYPDASVTDKLFRPVAKSGLGVDPETFFEVNFRATSLENFPYQGVNPRWYPPNFE
jgi:hypothetical protein